jgi:hypothetical protein
MKLIKLALLFAITFILPANALDIIAPSSVGGTTHKFAMILQKDLQDKGFDTKIIIAGNCVLGKKEWQDSKSAIFITTEASNSVPECTVEITKENYALNLFTAGWVIVSHTDSLGERMGVVSYMKQTVEDLDVKLVPYKNTTEIKAAFLAGEIDSGFLTTGRASEIKEKFVLINTMSSDKGAFANWKNNNLTLNYYVLGKNIDTKIINAMKNNAKIIDIANKKQMHPVELNTKEEQVEYLLRNQDKWTK